MWNIGWRFAIVCCSFLFCMWMMMDALYALPKIFVPSNQAGLDLRHVILLTIDCLALVAMAALSPKMWNYTIGYLGEKRVGKQLRVLSPDFKVISDLKPKKRAGNIDHVVVGPTGIFAIEAKTVLSLYYTSEHKSQARNCASMINEMLKNNNLSSPYVIPVVVFAWPYMNFNGNLTLSKRDLKPTLATGFNHINDFIKTKKGLLLGRKHIEDIARCLEVYKQK